jgi:hypothetical protein
MTRKDRLKLLRLRALLPEPDDELVQLIRTMVREELASLAADDWAPLLSPPADTPPDNCSIRCPRRPAPDPEPNNSPNVDDFFPPRKPKRA